MGGRNTPHIFMSKLIVPSILSDKYHNAENVLAADHLIKTKRDNPHDVWEVIDEVLKLWKDRHPDVWKSSIISTEQTRKTRANEFGANKKESLRYIVDMPEWVMSAIRMLYSPDELVMDKEFFQRFWKRYPAFRVSERS